MKTTTASNLMTTIGLIMSFIPGIGLFASLPLIGIAGILSLVAIAKDQKGGARMLVSAILAAPIAIVINIAVFAVMTEGVQ